jgi:hypothetical protein
LGDFQVNPTAREDRRSLALLVSLLLLFLLSPFASVGRRGEIVFIIAIYWTFVAAMVELSEKTYLRWPPLILAAASFSSTLLGVFHPARTVLTAQWALMSVFFGYVSVVLFKHLGRPGRITSGRLYVSVSLYLLLGLFYFAVFNLVDSLYPKSFVEAALPTGAGISSYSHLYFSLATLTTLGYGDIVPVTPLARILAVLEAATGVLYIAITVARLVAAYQSSLDDGN